MSINPNFQLNGKIGDVVIDNIQAGIGIVGAAGSYKSKGVLYDTLHLFFQKRQNMLVYDHAGDLSGGEVSRIIEGILEDYPQYSKYYNKPVYLDVENPQWSIKINIFDPKYYRDEADVKAVISTLYKSVKSKGKQISTTSGGEYFDTGVINFLSAVASYLIFYAPNEANFLTFSKILNTYEEKDYIKLFNEKNHLKAFAVTFMKAYKAKETIAGFEGSVANFVTTFQSALIWWMLYDDNNNYYDFTQINNTEKRNIFIMVNNKRNEEVYASVIAAIMQVIIKEVSIMHRKPLQIILDEGVALPLNDFSKVPAELRKYKIGVTYAIQNFSLAYKSMGQDEFHAIFGNLSTQFFGKITDIKTATSIEPLFEYVKKSQMSYTSGKHSSSTRSVQDKRIFMASDLIKLKGGRFIVFNNGSTKKYRFNPLVWHKYWWVRRVKLIKEKSPTPFKKIEYKTIKEWYLKQF